VSTVEELSNAVLNGLQAARASSGSVAEPDQLKSVSQMFVELGLDKLFFYQENIEQPYLTQVRYVPPSPFSSSLPAIVCGLPRNSTTWLNRAS
jgi:hypothetical protein